MVLPDIRVDIAREKQWQPLVAVIVARPGGAVQSERNVLGNCRIDFVSREARALGVRAGQTVAAARAKCAGLCVRVVAEETVRISLARIAESALAFGPRVAFDIARDVVWVDVSGCAHLFGSEIDLARALGACVSALGHACRVAVAGGPLLAEAFASFSRRPGADVFAPVVVPEEKTAMAVRALPIAALALDEDLSAWLADLGLFTCGDLQKLPRKALALRLGKRAHDCLQFLDGRDPTPLKPWRPPEIPEERVELDWGAHAIESLAFVFKTLCDRLAVRLRGRALGAARLELVLTLDRALCDTKACGHRLALSMVLPSPITRASDLLTVVRARLERCSLPAPVLAVTLRAPELARPRTRTLDLLAPEPKAEHALPRLVAELFAELDREAVGTLALANSWFPAERTRLVPFDHHGSLTETSTERSRHLLTTSSLEPSRLIQATRVSRQALSRAQHLGRIEAVQWWRASARLRHDLFASWFATSPQNGALAWLEVEGSCDKPLLRGWMD